MNHRTGTAIAALTAGAMAAATLQAARAEQTRLAASYAAVTLLLALLARHEYQAGVRARAALVRAERATRLRGRRSNTSPCLEWCCEQWWLTNGRTHQPDCRTLIKAAAS
ncbi:hypothetical protein [Streptomyces triculaminicus]|uniref:hypothetical protein n=1 Tax=Streptomyces triculaminicus TaxID=2816232 RepID=UPI0037B6EBE0